MPNRRQFLVGIAALFGLQRKPVKIILKPRSVGITTVTAGGGTTARQLRDYQFPSDVWSDEMMSYMEEQYSRVLSVACVEPVEFKFDLSEAKNNV